MAGALGPLLRFHLRLGVRFALRGMIPFVVPPIALVGLAPDPPETLVLITRLLLTEEADPAWLLVIGVIFLAAANQAMSRVSSDLTGWIRALPADETGRRRCVTLGCIAAQSPLLLVLALLAAGAVVSGQRLIASGLAGLFLLPVCAAYASLPIRRRALTATCGLAAAWLCVRGGWAEVASAAILLVVAESAAGPLRSVLPAAGFHRTSAFALPLVVNLRASGWRAAGSCLLATIPIVIAGLALTNNRLSGPAAGMIVRLATGLAVSMSVAGLVQTISTRRPPWPWSRSLPRSSRGRILDDALFLVLGSSPVILAASWLDPVPALTASLTVVWIAARAAGHLRRVHRHPLLDAGNRTALDGVIVSGLVTLLPWISILTTGLALHALDVSTRCDRRLKISLQADERGVEAGSRVLS